jgi:hypothetical protein
LLPSRAREARVDSSELCDRAAPSRPTGSSRLYGCGRRRHFVLADCCSQILVRGDDGARAIDDVGWRRRCASYGVIDNRSENLQH